MLLPYRLTKLHTATLILVAWLQIPIAQGEILRHNDCPLGFNSTFDMYGEPICYRRKGPEKFADVYKDCAGNLYTLELYERIRGITREVNSLWTQYKTAFVGGPFVDFSFGPDMGTEIHAYYAAKVEDHIDLDVEKELCVIKYPGPKFVGVRCDELHYRYCVISPDNMSKHTRDDCEALKDSWRFYSPIDTCLTTLSGTSEGSPATRKTSVRANWQQAQELCTKNGGSILNRGWRFANHPILRLPVTKPETVFPLGIIMSTNQSLLRYDAIGNHAEIPESEWNFYKTFEDSNLYGGLCGDQWLLVNTSYLFFNVICERTIPPENINLTLYVDSDKKLMLSVTDSMDQRNIHCFTDCILKFPNKVKFSRKNKVTFELASKMPGYYWCAYQLSNSYNISNKVLFLPKPDSVKDVYAVKIKTKHKHKINFDRIIQKILKEYLYLFARYTNTVGDLPDDSKAAEETLEAFKSSIGGVDLKEVEVWKEIQLKRSYLDNRTHVFHVELHWKVGTLQRGRWNNLEILSMKPVYQCKNFTSGGDIVKHGVLGETKLVGCTSYKCVGDFNEGVNWVKTAREGCVPTSTISSVLRVDEVTLSIPTASTTHQREPPKVIESESSEEEKRPSKPTTTSCPEDTETTESVTTVTTPAVTEEIITVTNIFPEETTVTTEPPRPPPSDQLLEEILQDLSNLVNASVPMENITNVFDQVDNILEVEENLEIPSRLLHLLDQLGSSVDLNGSQTASTVRNNIALLVADAGPNKPVQGLRIAQRASEFFTNDSFEIISKFNESVLELERNEAVVHLPASVAQSPRRISFVVFRTDRAFTRSSYAVNSRVLSVNVQNLTHFDKGEVIDIHISPINANITRNISRTCAYWHFTGEDDLSGYWSQEGCTFISATEEGMLDTCRCNHLTHFAEILVPRAVFSERNEDILELISIIGCCISIVGLSLVGLTASLFRPWRKEYNNKIWLQLCIAIFLMATCFLITIFARFDRYDIPCMLVGVALHYSVLASFCWMLVAAVLSYRRLVLVFARDPSHKLLKASAFSWGAPFAVVGVLLSAAPHSYAGLFEEKAPSTSFCYPSGLALWLAVRAPIAVMLLANWTLFVLIVRSVFGPRRIQRHGETNEALRCASVSSLLVFLFGLPWLFGLFAYNVVAAYLFTITATFQGFILFLFFVLGNKKTRDMWLNKLKIKHTRKVPVTSSTYTNRSVDWRAGNAPASMEANNSKPKSLSTDDAKFS